MYATIKELQAAFADLQRKVAILTAPSAPTVSRDESVYQILSAHNGVEDCLRLKGLRWLQAKTASWPANLQQDTALQAAMASQGKPTEILLTKTPRATAAPGATTAEPSLLTAPYTSSLPDTSTDNQSAPAITPAAPGRSDVKINLPPPSNCHALLMTMMSLNGLA